MSASTKEYATGKLAKQQARRSKVGAAVAETTGHSRPIAEVGDKGNDEFHPSAVKLGQCSSVRGVSSHS